MKKIMVLFFVVSLAITASIALQSINHSEIVITNYDGYYNNQWQEKVKKKQ